MIRLSLSKLGFLLRYTYLLTRISNNQQLKITTNSEKLQIKIPKTKLLHREKRERKRFHSTGRSWKLRLLSCMIAELYERENNRFL